MITSVLIRLDLAMVKPFETIKELPIWAPGPLIEECYLELVQSASSVGQFYDAAEITNTALRLLPMRIQGVEILTPDGLPLSEFGELNPMVQVLLPAHGSSRRAKNWELEDGSDFERLANLPVSFPETLLIE